MRPVLVSLCGLVAACSFDGSGIGDDAPIDARIDADPDAPDADPTAPDAGCGGAALSFEPANVARCDIPVPLGDFTFPDDLKVEIDTTTGQVLFASIPTDQIATAIVTQTRSSVEAMVVSAEDLTVPTGVDVVVTGSRPLILVAIGSMTINGRISANGSSASSGPGANLACQSGAGDPGAIQTAGNGLAGGSAGGGGAYGNVGGTGGYVSPVVASNQPTAGGAAWGSTLLTPLRGGCSGGTGAEIDGGAVAAGGGGGGLELVGETVIVTSDAEITASGGGGSGAQDEAAGGGGGGSGGAILFHAVGLTIAGTVTANGGAGGEGRRDTQPGTPGGDGNSTRALATTAAAGGMGAAGGNGGAGGVLLLAGGNGEAGQGSDTKTAGGGGGGGGIGRIHLDADSLNLVGGVFSPTPQ